MPKTASAAGKPPDIRMGAVMKTKRTFICCAIAAVIGTALLVGCDKKNDSIAQAEKQDVAQGVPAPGIEETKAIAEEAFIYGLPLVMNYAVMYEYAVDTKS